MIILEIEIELYFEPLNSNLTAAENKYGSGFSAAKKIKPFLF
jgi:hypothetical protein